MPQGIKKKVVLLIALGILYVIGAVGVFMLLVSFSVEPEHHNNTLFMQALGIVMFAVTLGIPVGQMLKKIWQKTKAVRESLVETTGKMFAFKKGAEQKR